MNIFAERLKECRKEKRLNQKTIAEKLGITQSSYSKYEYGLRQPTLETLVKITEVFDVTSDYLLGIDKPEKNTVSVNGTEFEITILVKTKEPSSAPAKKQRR